MGGIFLRRSFLRISKSQFLADLGVRNKRKFEQLQQLPNYPKPIVVGRFIYYDQIEADRFYQFVIKNELIKKRKPKGEYSKESPWVHESLSAFNQLAKGFIARPYINQQED